jgi:hypothetical protein
MVGVVKVSDPPFVDGILKTSTRFSFASVESLFLSPRVTKESPTSIFVGSFGDQNNNDKESSAAGAKPASCMIKTMLRHRRMNINESNGFVCKYGCARLSLLVLFRRAIDHVIGFDLCRPRRRQCTNIRDGFVV